MNPSNMSWRDRWRPCLSQEVGPQHVFIQSFKVENEKSSFSKQCMYAAFGLPAQIAVTSHILETKCNMDSSFHALFIEPLVASGAVACILMPQSTASHSPLIFLSNLHVNCFQSVCFNHLLRSVGTV